MGGYGQLALWQPQVQRNQNPQISCIVPRFCAVADELNDRIYMIGGPKPWSKKQCRYYKVSTNTWHECIDKTLVEETYVSLAPDAFNYSAKKLIF